MKKNTKVKAGKERVTISYEFTKQELEAKGLQLSQACATRNQLEDEKKKVTSEFKYKIDGVNAEINLISKHISEKFEMRRVEADMEIDYDTQKRYYYVDGVLVKSEQIREEDYQLQFSAVE